MDAPKCGLCGERHWSGEGHRWKDGDVFTTVTHPIDTGLLPNSVTTVSGGDIIWTDSLPWRGAMLAKGVNNDINGILVEPFVNNIVNKPNGRKEYMREYMRKRRAGGD